jgi:D-glycero-D-manno-heptose 1,7-bisphosphate phosphatase
MNNSITDKWVSRPALCLDFDGTIRYSKNGKFINHPDDVVLYQDVEQKIWTYRDKGYLVFGITNQGGVAFGYKSTEGNDQEIQRTLDLFEENPFHLVQSSYGHPEGTLPPFNHNSLLRKPYYGMLVLCEVEAKKIGVVVEWEKSIFVGDRPEDEACAQAAGLTFIEAATFFDREETQTP